MASSTNIAGVLVANGTFTHFSRILLAQISSIPEVEEEKITALQQYITTKQQKQKYLEGKASELYADIEYAQDELDVMQEEYDKYFILLKSCVCFFLTDHHVQMSKQSWYSGKKPYKGT